MIKVTTIKNIKEKTNQETEINGGHIIDWKSILQSNQFSPILSMYQIDFHAEPQPLSFIFSPQAESRLILKFIRNRKAPKIHKASLQNNKSGQSD